MADRVRCVGIKFGGRRTFVVVVGGHPAGYRHMCDCDHDVYRRVKEQRGVDPSLWNEAVRHQVRYNRPDGQRTSRRGFPDKPSAEAFAEVVRQHEPRQVNHRIAVIDALKSYTGDLS